MSFQNVGWVKKNPTYIPEPLIDPIKLSYPLQIKIELERPNIVNH